MSAGDSDISNRPQPAEDTVSSPAGEQALGATTGGRGARPHGGLLGQALGNRWFLGCLALLVAATVGFEFKFRNTVIRKDPMPLRKSLGQLDWRNKLVFSEGGKRYSYRLEGRPDELDPESVNKLGTTEFIGWRLRLWDDTQERPTEHLFHLFITYYTGKPDQVPHVPEECMLGSGFYQAKDWAEHVNLPNLPQKDQVADLQALLFVREGGSMIGTRDCELVMYTFRANDKWQADREDVRRTLGNPFDRSAYFSKVELAFPLPPEMPEEAVKKAMQEGKRFLEVALPVLVQEHWPVWQSGNPQTQPGERRQDAATRDDPSKVKG
jgi:hypothetical protein